MHVMIECITKIDGTRDQLENSVYVHKPPPLGHVTVYVSFYYKVIIVLVAVVGSVVVVVAYLFIIYLLLFFL